MESITINKANYGVNSFATYLLQKTGRVNITRPVFTQLITVE